MPYSPTRTRFRPEARGQQSKWSLPPAAPARPREHRRSDAGPGDSRPVRRGRRHYGWFGAIATAGYSAADQVSIVSRFPGTLQIQGRELGVVRALRGSRPTREVELNVQIPDAGLTRRRLWSSARWGLRERKRHAAGGERGDGGDCPPVAGPHGQFGAAR